MSALCWSDTLSNSSCILLYLTSFLKLATMENSTFFNQKSNSTVLYFDALQLRTFKKKQTNQKPLSAQFCWPYQWDTPPLLDHSSPTVLFSYSKDLWGNTVVLKYPCKSCGFLDFSGSMGNEQSGIMWQFLHLAPACVGILLPFERNGPVVMETAFYWLISAELRIALGSYGNLSNTK